MVAAGLLALRVGLGLSAGSGPLPEQEKVVAVAAEVQEALEVLEAVEDREAAEPHREVPEAFLEAFLAASYRAAASAAAVGSAGRSS